MEEKWAKIKGQEGFYEVSNMGNVRSYFLGDGTNNISDKPRNLKLTTNTQGYNVVGLRQKQFKVHQLVLTAFVGECPDGMECCHNNGIRNDNRVENLRWDTKKGNMADKVKHGTTTRNYGESNGQSFLTNGEVWLIKKLLSSNKFTQEYIGRMFKVNNKFISKIYNGDRWGHIKYEY